MLYGIHAVSAAWTNPDRACLRLLMTPGGAEAMAGALEAASKLKRPLPSIVSRQDLDRLAPNAVHQGVILDAQALEESSLAEILMAAEAGPAIVLVLDKVTDPHNVGAILRSAAAFGAAAVIVPRHGAPEIGGVLAKTASGAVEHVPYVRVGNLARALEELLDAGFVTVALDERGDRTLAEVPKSDRMAIILGAEGEGLRRLTLEASQYKAKLPTGGPVGSLNVSNAACLALYELRRDGKGPR